MRSIAMVLAVALLACAKGDEGEPDPQGPVGQQGAPGDDGNPGLAGTDGEDGTDGRQGTIGTQGAQGPQGDPGSIGPQGPPGAGTWVWKDANGSVLPGIQHDAALFGQLPWLGYIDPQGYVWKVQAEVLLAFEVSGATTYYTATDCSGTAYLHPPPLPRFTFYVPSEQSIRVRNDNAQLVSITPQSMGGGNEACTLATQPLPNALPMAGTTIVPSTSVPNLSAYTAPVHPEL